MKKLNKPYILYAIWSKTENGFATTRLRKYTTLDNLDDILLYSKKETAVEEIETRIRYLTNPEKIYRSKDYNVDEVKKYKIVKFNPKILQ